MHSERELWIIEMLKWMGRKDILRCAFRMLMKFTVFHNLAQNWAGCNS
jgi:hypothetical protein